MLNLIKQALSIINKLNKTIIDTNNAKFNKATKLMPAIQFHSQHRPAQIFLKGQQMMCQTRNNALLNLLDFFVFLTMISPFGFGYLLLI